MQIETELSAERDIQRYVEGVNANVPVAAEVHSPAYRYLLMFSSLTHLVLQASKKEAGPQQSEVEMVLKQATENLTRVIHGFATQTTANNEAAARQNAANIEAAARQNTENNEAVASRQTESLALISSQGERFTKALIEQATLHAETQSKMLKVIHSFAQGGT